MNNELTNSFSLIRLKKRKKKKKRLGGDCFRFAEKQNPPRPVSAFGIFDTINAFYLRVFSSTCSKTHLSGMFSFLQIALIMGLQTLKPTRSARAGVEPPGPGPAAWLGPCAELRAWHRVPGGPASRRSRSPASRTRRGQRGDPGAGAHRARDLGGGKWGRGTRSPAGPPTSAGSDEGKTVFYFSRLLLLRSSLREGLLQGSREICGVHEQGPFAWQAPPGLRGRAESRARGRTRRAGPGRAGAKLGESAGRRPCPRPWWRRAALPTREWGGAVCPARGAPRPPLHPPAAPGPREPAAAGGPQPRARTRPAQAPPAPAARAEGGATSRRVTCSLRLGAAAGGGRGARAGPEQEAARRHRRVPAGRDSP